LQAGSFRADQDGVFEERKKRYEMAADVEKIQAIASRVAATHGVELVEVDLRGGGKARTLRIIIDKPEGVTHEDCANVSREVSTILDVEEAVPGGSYTLEVSSPGLDRKLLGAKDYLRFIGSRIKLMTREPVNGNRHFEGRLDAFAEDRLVLEVLTAKKKPKPGHAQPGPKVEIDLANVEKANLVPEV
jgi:ribosome maturation factor RimP